MKRNLVIGIWLLGIVGVSCGQYIVEGSAEYRDPRTDLTILAGSVELPTGGDWYLKPKPQSSDGLSDAMLLPSDEAYKLRKGRRTRLIEEDRQRKHGQRILQSLYWELRRYATEHDGIAPAQLSDLQYQHWNKAEETSRVHYIPGTRLLNRKDTDTWVNASTNLLAFEIKPAIDDGKHWVLRSDGTVRSEAIDPTLLRKYGVELTPGNTQVVDQLKTIPDTLTYRVFALRRSDGDGSASLVLGNRQSSTDSSLSWDYSNPDKADAGILKEWGRIRMWQWASMDQGEGASALTYCVNTMARQYGVDAPQRQADRNRRRDDARQTTLFSILGGRAAIRETLQMQSIDTSATITNTPTLPMDSIEGVTVKSHPFEAMLGDAKGGELALANYAPVDRLFAYFAKPEAMLQMMDGGTDFIFHGGASFTGRSIEYGLVKRYLGRLGISETWVRSFLKGGAIAETAVMLPDLLLVDGTDFTVVSRLESPRLAKASLALLGLQDLSKIVPLKTADGGTAFWTQRADLLVISTQRQELERIVALVNDSAQSLGQSAEFRYMLSQQPLNASTRAYVYFSDPFIRRLVGPEAKIGQLRRLRARSELEGIAAGYLMSKVDGQSDSTSLAALIRKGYVMPPQLVEDAVLDADGCVASERYGDLHRLTTLLSQPIETITQAEAEAYSTYLQNYNRFWRRFFDPIGIRLDQPETKAMELSVFILPLIDNSIYQGLRETLISGENATPLPLPELLPQPVATLSFNLNEQSWMKLVDGMDDMLEKMLGIGPDILDHLGPDIHMAMGDADPIINMGSGEFTALAGIGGSGFNNEMMMIPALISMLTRPCVLMLGLDDAQQVRTKLRQMQTGTQREWFGGSSGSFYKLAGRDAWHYVISMEGVISLRFGLEIKDRYLVISNLPLSHNPAVTSWSEAPHNAAAIELNPGACLLQMPALYTSASSRQREAAMAGLGCLYPILRTGVTDVDTAIALHRKRFGFAPLHPGRGAWQWDGSLLSSTEFGYPGREEQPEYDADDVAYGVFRGIKSLGLSMQFEDDGLRSRCRWLLK